MKLRKRIFSFLFLVGLVVSALAEEPFNGLVLDREMKPKKGVKVYVKDPKRYATTDKKGRFGLTDGSRSTRYDTSYSYDSMGNLICYMYNGKELDRMHGLDWYDYGARHYDAAIGRWHSMDDMCYAYYDISPYAYCCGDPVNAIDPDGRSTWVTNQDNS